MTPARLYEEFDEEALLADARAIDGLDAFGDEGFREPLRMLLASLAEAPLSPLGVAILRGGVVRSLANRLRLHHWLTRHPEIADERIEAPLVVVGMMRSGTTLVQRLLASDPRHTCTLGWEALEPAPRLDWDPSNPGRPDPRIAAAEARESQARTFAPALFAIHPTYAHEAEEEIMFLADAFLSHVPEASCDVPAYRSWLDDQDFTPAYRHLHRTLQLLQWQKRRRGEHGERWVLKTPAHLGYLDLLFETLPGAHVVHMHRDPLETIPSGASLNTTLWRMHSDRVDPVRVGRQWIERMAWTSGRALAARDRMPDEDLRFTDLHFRAVVDDPLGQVQRIYDAIGAPLTEEARTAMRAWLERDAQEKLPKHGYTAGDFGLSQEMIREAFAAYTDRFLDARGEGGATRRG